MIVKAYGKGDWLDLMSGGAPSKGGAIFELLSADHLTAAESDGAILIGDDLTANTLTEKQRSIFTDRWGVIIPGDVLSVADAMVRVLGVDAHPDGELGPRPVMPTTKGLFSLRFAVFGTAVPEDQRFDLLLGQERFNPAFPDVPHFAGKGLILDCCRDRIKQANDTQGTEFAKKVSGFELVTRFGVKIEDVHLYGKEIMPVELRNETPSKPETTITDTFTDGDGTTVTGWTEVQGGWSIASNKLENDTPGGDAEALIRNDTALSGADHFSRASVTWESGSSRRAGPCARFSGAAATCYAGHANASNDDFGIIEYTAGSALVLASYTANVFGASTVTEYIQADGSVISGWFSSPSSVGVSFTDTSLGNFSVGIAARSGADGNNHKFDDFRAGDFSGGGTVARLINGGRVHV